MLHIFLMILKIIGIIIAVILGLLLLITLVVLLVPLRYKMDAKCSGDLQSLDVSVRFSWFLHLISGYILYRDKETDWNLRVAWKKMNTQETSSEESSPEGSSPEESSPEDSLELSSEDNSLKEKEEPAPKKQDTNTLEVKKPEIKIQKEETSEESPKGKGRKQRRHFSFFNKIKEFFQKIKYTITNICDKIKLIGEKKDKIVKFIEHEVHRSAFTKAKKELIRLFKFLKPKKLKGRIHYGFEDPYMTGKVLAGLSMLYPFYGENLMIEPDFEEKVLEGELHVKGHVRGLYAVIIAFNVLINKDIRTTYKHIKNFKL